MNVYKGSFFYLVLRHWLATHQTQCHPGRTWTLYCGTVLWLGQSAALPSLSPADAIRTRRPWLGRQPWARRESKHLANCTTPD